MKIDDIEIGGWYKIYKYGGDYGITGQVVDTIGSMVAIKFYWGSPYRSTQYIDTSNIVAKSKNPGLFRNHILFKETSDGDK